MWPNAATGAMSNTGAKVGYRLASFFGKIDYNWRDLVLASFTLRRDGSSRFGKDNRWGTFPAATVGFRISQLLEKQWPILNLLGMRGSTTLVQMVAEQSFFQAFIAQTGD